MSTPQKRKGDAYERELAKYLNDNVYRQERCFRAPLSGGGTHNLQHGGSDIVGATDLFIEAKRTERLNIRDAIRQAIRNKTESKSPEIPVVITRRNRESTGESIVALHLKDFIRLYEAFLLQNGNLYETRFENLP